MNIKLQPIKIIAFTGIIILSILACKSVLGEISEVKKSVVYPGVEHGHKYMKYTAGFKVIKPLKINKVELLLSDKSILIEDYKIVDKKAGIVLPRKKFIQPGNYLFEADLLFVKELTGKGDRLKIQVESESGKTYELTTNIVEGETIMRM